MSYILEALRRSESERQQGRVPDLANSVQMVHKPKRRAIPVGVWVALALFFNGAVLAVIFWPGSGFLASSVDSRTAEPAEQTASNQDVTVVEPSVTMTPVPETDPEPKLEPQLVQAPATPSKEMSKTQGADDAVGEPMLITPSSTYNDEVYPEAEAGPTFSEAPTLIVPSTVGNSSGTAGDAQNAAPEYDFADGPPVEHLVEKPVAFQRSIPDLRFSSHIYASDPAARRVMINDNYLRPGDSFSGIRVEAITADGVVLSAYGETFRVGVVRDWFSPR